MAANVYYSVSPFGTGDIKTGSPTISISSGVATLSVGQTGNIGQGCRITYNTSSVCYISQVNSSTSFNVVTATGGTPGDVSGQTVNSIAHEYASASAAEAGCTDANHVNNASLVSADVAVHIACYYDHNDYTGDTAEVTVAGITSDATRYIKFYTPTGGTQSINNQRHSGVWDDEKYYIEYASYFGVITCAATGPDGVKVIGLQISNTKAATSSGPCAAGVYFAGHTGLDLEVGYCIIRKVNSVVPDWTCGGIAGHYGKYFKLYNNIIYDFYGRSLAVNYIDDNGYAYIYNNTVINSVSTDVALQAATYGTGVTYRIKNNITQGGGTGYSLSGAATTEYLTNLSEDTSSPNSALRSKAVTFVDEAGKDFRLASTDTSALDAGTDLESDSYLPFSDDIAGTTRSGTWDIGAFEYVAAAPALAFPPLFARRQNTLLRR